MIRQRTAFRIALMGAAVPAALMLSAGSALAASDVTVSNTETIEAHLDATGKVQDKRVYEQLAFTGKGKVDVSNPVSTDGLRNLDGFKGYDVKDGKMVASVDVDGDKRMRTVSNFTKDLPLNIAVTYTLDGKQVQPGDVVGKNGILEVHYKVTNNTGKTGTVSYDDGTGKQVTKDEQITIPMVGSLSTTLPSSFTEVSSDEANMAGDGHGGTLLSFTMTLFAPIGSETAEFGYKARIKDGVVPTASVSALPVDPLASPSFSGGAASYKGGAETGAQLTSGAIQIDENLLKLRDGSAKLLAGLIKLQGGAHQLSDGLNNDAAPGAALLADGATKLNAGVGVLAKGTKDAKKGSSQLADGAAELDFQLAVFQGGLTDLADGIKAIPSNADYKKLLAGIDSIQAAIGNPADPTTLRGGLTLLKSGVTGQLQPGVSALISGITTLKGKIDDSISSDVPQLTALATTAKSNVQTLAVGKGCIDGSGPHPAANADCPNLLAALQAAGTLVVAMDTPVGTTGAPDGGLKQKLQAASVALDSHLPKTYGASDPGGVLYGLGSISAGIDNHAPGTHGPTDPGGLEYGLNKLIVGTDTHTPGTYGATDPGGLAYGMGAVNAGVQQLVDTIVASLLDSLGTPSTDPESTARGAAAALNDGAGQIADGADQLDSGLGKINSGAGQLGDGAGQLSDGANKLSSGLGDAASGSSQLAAGTDTAAEGAPAITEGAQQLSDQGTKVLIGKGKDTAQTFGEKYALIDAGAKRAQTESMAYGAPEGATGQTAYTMELAGADGESGRNWGRGLGALAIFAIAGGAAAALRQRLV
ncbi:hypothetical protein ACPPVT_10595 [Angustibacter sp. McL0619]|uniref:hypothetical protein n=1 Tax=Angustibacter sp. McL0619 TaxID=3415676 RepID=UPI003CEC85CC